MSKVTKATKDEVAAPSTSQSVVVKEAPGDLALLSELQGIAQEHGGLVHVRQELLRIPRLKLVQGSSSACKSGLAKVGEFACDVRGINYGAAVEIIPISITESASLMPRGAKRPICSSNNLVTNQNGIRCDKCPHQSYWNDWGLDGKTPPKCKNAFDVLCLVAGEDKPMILSLRSNNQKGGKSLINLVTNDPRRVPFASAYRLSAIPAKSAAGEEFHSLDQAIERRALSNDELTAILPTIKQVLEAKKAGRLQQDDDEPEVGDREPGGDDFGDDIPL